MHARGGRAVALALLVALAALAVQCGGGGDDSDDGGSAAATTNGAAIAADLFDGKTVEEFFAVTCVACHGAGRQGLPGLGLPLTPETLIQDDQFYFDTIANGRPNTLMPPWKAAGVSDDEITALVTWLKFDGKTVEEFFAVTCVACHGADRQGLPGLGLPLTPETLIQDDQFYFDTIANGRPNTLMPPWKAAGVSDDEITALVTWLKSAQP